MNFILKKNTKDKLTSVFNSNNWYIYFRSRMKIVYKYMTKSKVRIYSTTDRINFCYLNYNFFTNHNRDKERQYKIIKKHYYNSVVCWKSDNTKRRNYVKLFFMYNIDNYKIYVSCENNLFLFNAILLKKQWSEWLSLLLCILYRKIYFHQEYKTF